MYQLLLINRFYGFLKRFLLVSFLFFSFQSGFSQVPSITYQTPQRYAINTAISPLIPKNTGGTVPATFYGSVTTLAGVLHKSGSINGPLSIATFNQPRDAVVDAAGNIFIVDDNNTIRKITVGGVVEPFVGSGLVGFTDGTGAAASFANPVALAIDKNGNIFVPDRNNSAVRKVTPAGVVTTIAGNGTIGFTDGTGAAATFHNPTGIAVDGSGNLYIADQYNCCIRKITPAGVVTTFAGNGNVGSADGVGTAATFSDPGDVTTDAAGNIYVADDGNQKIRKITPAGVVTTLAGSGNAGGTDGFGSNASFNDPINLATDAAGNIYVADGVYNQDIRKITPDGLVTTIAGTVGVYGYADGVGTKAMFSYPYGVATDNKGGLIIADNQNQLYRKISLTGYTINKPLPEGLTFNSITGVISGTPTVFSPPTDYLITATNSFGTGSFVINIEVSSINFPPLQPETVCSGDFELQATSSAGKVSFTSSNVFVATVTGGVLHIVGAGNTLITANDGVTSQQQLLTVTSPVVPSAVISSYSGACAGMPVNFTVSVTNGGSNPVYQWQLNGVNAGVNSAHFSSTVSPTDIITCTVTNTDGCPASGTTPQLTGVKSQPTTTPEVAIAASAGTVLCSGTTITFTATANAGGLQPSYQWQVNGKNAGSNSPEFSSADLINGDQVNCIITIKGGVCLATNMATSNTIDINITTRSAISPTITITVSGNGESTGQLITFTASTQNVNTQPVYQWTVNGNNAGTNSNMFSSSELKNGDVVTCTLEPGNSCNPPFISNPIAVIILPPKSLNIPNTFTPNGDGINDTWNVPALADYPGCIVNIFNRYGLNVFHSIGYSKPWDGTICGNPLPSGTYYYLINLKNNDKPLANWIQIIK